MKKRHDEQTAVGGRQLVSLGNVVNRRAEILMCQWHALWTGGCARGMKEHGDVLRCGCVSFYGGVWGVWGFLVGGRWDGEVLW